MPNARIVHYNGEEVDDEAEPMHGWYFFIVNDDNKPMGLLTGPYSTQECVERAAQTAYATGDFWLPPDCAVTTH